MARKIVSGQLVKLKNENSSLVIAIAFTCMSPIGPDKINSYNTLILKILCILSLVDNVLKLLNMQHINIIN